ncbi:hypothetical protein TNCV_4368591 [Trichonephila clavipes]|nr:hypothetical protein TNCV_4368591 [Trichonephila clavipes]
MPSPGFEPRSYGTAVKVTDHCTGNAKCLDFNHRDLECAVNHWKNPESVEIATIISKMVARFTDNLITKIYDANLEPSPRFC